MTGSSRVEGNLYRTADDGSRLTCRARLRQSGQDVSGAILKRQATPDAVAAGKKDGW
jgi:hypothetical protein